MRSNGAMGTPNVFVAYAPLGAGLRCAVAYRSAERDVYGWFTGPAADGGIAAQYFLMEDFYSNRPARYEAVDQAALHSRWSLDEARRHELAALQEAFAREWLVAGLSKLQPNWTWYSPRCERSVLRHLAKRWPLEYRFDAGEAALS
jgi:hypothetical protein